jgi:hypothetical protein
LACVVETDISRSVYQQHFAQVVNNEAMIDRYICPPDDYLAVTSPDYFTWREIRTILAVTNQIARRVDFTGVIPGRGHKGCAIGWRWVSSLASLGLDTAKVNANAVAGICTTTSSRENRVGMQSQVVDICKTGEWQSKAQRRGYENARIWKSTSAGV